MKPAHKSWSRISAVEGRSLTGRPLKKTISQVVAKCRPPRPILEVRQVNQIKLINSSTDLTDCDEFDEKFLAEVSQDFTQKKKPSASVVIHNDEEEEGTVKETMHGSRSIEIFSGMFQSFDTFFQSLCNNGISTSGKSKVTKMKIKPELIKRVVLVDHPLTSLKGLNHFVKLGEVWITNCVIKEAKWSDFNGLNHLHKLYLYNCEMEKVEPLFFNNLHVLWLNGNNLTSLEFLGKGLPCLVDLNVARNDIQYLEEEHLMNCVNLGSLNLSGNPLCTIQDVKALKVLNNLKTLYLCDPVFGKCPLVALCESRTMILSFLSLTKLSSIDGKAVTRVELNSIKDYVNSRCLYYFANSVRGSSEQASLRKASVSFIVKQLDEVGTRILDLIALVTRFKRTINHVEGINFFGSVRSLMKDQVLKLDHRIQKLRKWTEKSVRRVEKILLVSKWEEDVESWMKWIEFQSFGSIQCQVSHSIHDTLGKEPSHVVSTMFQLISALTCPSLWPPNTMLKIEVIVTVRDKGMESGMERTFQQNFAEKYEPKFVPPVLPDEKTTPTAETTTDEFDKFYSLSLPGAFAPSTGPPNVPTYTTPDLKPTPPIYPFPDSIMGLPERSQPLFLFLVPPERSKNPVAFLQKVITEKSLYKEIRLTNCLWMSIRHSKQMDFSVVVVVKVLEECLITLPPDKRACHHQWDCSMFALKLPMCYAPAYIVNISFQTEDRNIEWQRTTLDDRDIIEPSESLIASIGDKINSHNYCFSRYRKANYVRKKADGFIAEMASAQLVTAKDGSLEACANPAKIDHSRETSPFLDVSKVRGFLGREVCMSLTCLDLSGNRIAISVGLERMNNLKKLNLSHNNLTTLTGLQKLPSLVELKVGWNRLRFLHTTIAVIADIAPKLIICEVIPNPFQDVKDFEDIPVLFSKVLKNVVRVDYWSTPFVQMKSPALILLGPPPVAETGFVQVALASTWPGTMTEYNELRGKCLMDLDDLPTFLPAQDSSGRVGLSLNLADNYLTSFSISRSPLVTRQDWQASLVNLQLQGNMIACLEWMKGAIFPNLQILNLANNQLTELALLPSSCLEVRHLILTANHFGWDLGVLSPLKKLNKLLTLDISVTKISKHPDYAEFIIRNVPSLEVLDGVGKGSWELENSMEKIGGSLISDWLEEKVGQRHWGSPTRLSLSSCGIQKVNLPASFVPKLACLDLSFNSLSNLTGLTSILNLRVLCMSNNVETGNSPYSIGGPRGRRGFACDDCVRQKELATFGGNSGGLRHRLSGKAPFPKLEVLIMAHNELSGLSNLHLHSMPSLHNVILNFNNIGSGGNFEEMPTVKIIVLDHNRIRDVPFTYSGFKSLRFLHLEHNKIVSLPRIPHLSNLVNLYLSFNKIQSLTDLSLLKTNLYESYDENPNNSQRADHRMSIASKLPKLTILDSKEVLDERYKLSDIGKEWPPGAPRDYSVYDPAFKEFSRIQSMPKEESVEWPEQTLGLRVRILNIPGNKSSSRTRRVLQIQQLKKNLL